jgi:hypothetical protein
MYFPTVQMWDAFDAEVHAVEDSDLGYISDSEVSYLQSLSIETAEAEEAEVPDSHELENECEDPWGFLAQKSRLAAESSRVTSSEHSQGSASAFAAKDDLPM